MLQWATGTGLATFSITPFMGLPDYLSLAMESHMKIYRIYTLHWEDTNIVYVGMSADVGRRFLEHCKTWETCPSHYEIEASYFEVGRAREAETKWILHFYSLGLCLNKQFLSAYPLGEDITPTYYPTPKAIKLSKSAREHLTRVKHARRILAPSNVLENAENVGVGEAKMRGVGLASSRGVGAGSRITVGRARDIIQQHKIQRGLV